MGRQSQGIWRAETNCALCDKASSRCLSSFLLLLRRPCSQLDATTAKYLAMINAFLVFNDQGQPRLTKFYTQLVGIHSFLFGLQSSSYSF